MQRVKYILAGTVLSAFLDGCTTTNPYTGERETSRSPIYSVLGGAGGAIVGGLTGGERGALAGAAAGAAAGAGYGYYRDKQADELRQKLHGTGVQVQKTGKDAIRLVMPGNVTFALNSPDINKQFYRTLDSVAVVLKKYHDNLIAVNGYTDSTGPLAYNKKLSFDRATSVASYLASQGVLPGRMSVQGFGPADPVASNKTAAGRQQNRRVEIMITQRKTL